MADCKIGYIDDFEGWEENLFVKVAKAKKLNLLPFNINEEFSENKLRDTLGKCDIIYNDTSSTLAREIVKTLEEMGKKVVEASHSFYYNEDKWLFYVKCKEHGIPTPLTLVLSTSLNGAKKDLEELGEWPVILKRIDCYGGHFVEKADNLAEAEEIITKFWQSSGDKVPIIAQEFIKSYCYRVLMIDGRIVQTALKKGHGWKLTGLYAQRFWKFKPDKTLVELSKQIADMTKIKVLGIDFLKRNGRWVVLECNAEPSLAFFDSDKEMMIEKVLDFLVKEASG